MKKILLSFLCCMLAVIGMQAEEVTKSVTFSSYTAGTQYAQNEKHDLGDGLVIYTTECHFTSELRIYSSSTYNGYVVSDKLPGTITKMTFNMGYKSDVLNVYGSTDGKSWVLVSGISVTSSYKDYSLTFTGAYTYFKLDVSGSKQVRIKTMSVTYVTGETPETPDPVDVPEPTFSVPAGEVEQGDEVAISVEGEYDIYYSTTGDVEANYSLYTGAIAINETTTIYAYAQDAEENKSDVVSATYEVEVVVEGDQEEVILYPSQVIGQGKSGGGAGFSYTVAPITFNFSNAYGNSDNHIRAYGKCSIALSGAQITKVVITATNSDYIETWDCSEGKVTVSDKTATWEGLSNNFTLTNTSNSQARIVSITVTYVVDAEAVNVAEPTFSEPAGEVEQGTVVTINVEDGLTAYYSLTGEEGSYVAGYQVTINEATTIYAYAQDAEENKSDVVSAQYTVFIPVEGTWTLVTDANTLCNGDEVVIVAKDYDVALSTDAGNNRDQAAVKKEGNDVKFAQDVQVITLGEVGEVSGVRTWSMLTAEGYLYSPGTSNGLKTTNDDEEAAWSIAIGDEATGYAAGIIDMNNDAAEPANVMRYNSNSSSTLFSCYKENNSQKDIVIYRKVREANIAATMYYLLPGVWETPDAPWYAAYFYNQNNGTAEWVRGFLSEHIVYFDLKAAGSFTHITFCRMNPAYQEMTFDAAPVTRSSDPEARIWDQVTVAYTGENPVYSINDAAWTSVATGIEGVVAANGIAYANGVVAAEGAIEVYNVNGMVVARGNESLDLRNLNAGVYIVRNGNNVRKVVR